VIHALECAYALCGGWVLQVHSTTSALLSTVGRSTCNLAFR
jgi:hypothetical protein